ncbi:MAG: hypothetical protein SGPRY_013657, partial [Prymnesium sp.]
MPASRRRAGGAPQLRCCHLPDACIVILPNPSTLEQWRRGIDRSREPAQFTLHVGGLSPSELSQMQAGCLTQIRDPLYPARLRHLERDRACEEGRRRCHTGIVHEANSTTMRAHMPAASGNLTMIWPHWENGYGDVVAQTLLPLGELVRRGQMPAQLALSGLQATPLVDQLLAISPRACAFERAHSESRLRRHPSSSHPSPSIFSLASQTHQVLLHSQPMSALPLSHHSTRLQACVVSHRVDVLEAWEDMAAIDTAVGWRHRPLERAAFDPHTEAGRLVARVLLATRQPHGMHSRLIVNQHELLTACDMSTISLTSPSRDITLVCRQLAAGAKAATQVELLQWADVYVTIWGGDTINALHMRRDGVVIEMVPEMLALYGPNAWVKSHRGWITRSSRRRTGYGKLRMIIPREATLIRGEVKACEERREAKRRKVKGQSQGGRLHGRPKETLNASHFSWE